MTLRCGMFTLGDDEHDTCIISELEMNSSQQNGVDFSPFSSKILDLFFTLQFQNLRFVFQICKQLDPSLSRLEAIKSLALMACC